MVESFVSGQVPVARFSGEFFRAFQSDHTDWDEDAFVALNEIALTCEAYTPHGPYGPFDATELQLRDVCFTMLERLRRIQNGGGGTGPTPSGG